MVTKIEIKRDKRTIFTFSDHYHTNTTPLPLTQKGNKGVTLDLKNGIGQKYNRSGAYRLNRAICHFFSNVSSEPIIYAFFNFHSESVFNNFKMRSVILYRKYTQNSFLK